MSAPTSKPLVILSVLAIVVAGVALGQAFLLVSQLAQTSESVSQIQAKVATLETPAPKSVQFSVFLGEVTVLAEEEGMHKEVGEYHRWEPQTLVVKKGDTVTIEVKNPRKHIHSFAIPAYNVDTGPLEPRTGTATVKFVADREGVYVYECNTDFDEEKGQCDPDHSSMTGYIVVMG